MGWLGLGVAYSIIYAVIGAYLRPYPDVLPWFRIVSLLLPPLVGVTIIARRRHAWAGCQWLFWATLALGLVMSGISVISWSVDEMLLGVGTSWLGWHAVFALFGGVAPLLALLAQPHRGPREKSHGDDCRRHRGHRGAHRFSLFTLCCCSRWWGGRARYIGGAALVVRAAAVPRVRRDGSRRAPHARSRVEAGVPAARAGPLDFFHHSYARQRGNLAGLLSERVSRRRHVDSAVCVLSVGRVGGAAFADLAY